jgi:hypothetical protein
MFPEGSAKRASTGHLCPLEVFALLGRPYDGERGV